MDARRIAEAVRAVTKDWARQRKREERDANAAARRRDALTRRKRVGLYEAACRVMEEAYLEASNGGKLPTRPRQIFYRARPPILEATGREDLGGNHFSQKLLVRYMAENPETTAKWDIVWDDRGHFAEPHTRVRIGMGTLAVRKYLAGVEAPAVAGLHVSPLGSGFPTCGPRNRFRAVLFIEKEGFLPLFDAVRLADRYDIAIASGKGMSTTAARALVDHLCGKYGVPLLILHDFDKSGFSILGTLCRDTPRYRFANEFQRTDLGLRLADVEAYQLESEAVVYGKKSDPRENLRRNGATEAEVDFLCSQGDPYRGYSGRRVELNAFTGDGLIAWLEAKFHKHGIKKVVPDAATLEDAYRRAVGIAAVNQALPELVEAGRREAEAVKPPAALEKKVRKMLRDNPAMPWDVALAELVKGKGESK